MGATFAPIPSLLGVDGGVYLPKRCLDRFLSSSQKALRNIVFVGDSITQGQQAKRTVADGVTSMSSPVVTSATAAFVAEDVGSRLVTANLPTGTVILSVDSSTQVTVSQNATASGTAQKVAVTPDSFVDRLRNYLASIGAVGHAGFQGLWKGDLFVGWLAGLNEQDITHAKTWARGIVSNRDMAPFGYQELAPATASSVVALVGATMGTTSGSTAVTFSGAVANLSSANSVGCLIMGVGIPDNTIITAVADTTHLTINNPATATNSNQNFRIEGPHIMWTRPSYMTVGQIDLLWIDSSGSSGANFSYSTDGGTTWTNIAQALPSTPVLNKTSITVSNPTTLIVRAYAADGAPNTIGTFGRPCLAGSVVYSTASPTGIAVHNIGLNASLLSAAASSNTNPGLLHSYTIKDLVTTGGSATITSASGTFRWWMGTLQISGTNIPAGTTATVVDHNTLTLSANATGSGTVTAYIGTQAPQANAWLSNSLGGTFAGIKPDLIVVMFSNDMGSWADPVRYTDMLDRLYAEVHAYADLLVMNHYEQGGSAGFPGRSRDLTNVVTNGTTTVTCAIGGFGAGDVGAVVSGPSIPSNDAAGAAVTIASVTNSTTIVLSTAATGPGTTSGTLTIDRSVNNQANYRAAIQAWCVTNDVACVDLYDALVAEGITGYSAANSEGLMHDTLHPTTLGHLEYGGHIIRALAMASGL